MTGRMYDLAFEQMADGTISLEQKDYCGESYVIDLHPCQLRHIAERAGLLAPAPTAAWPRGFRGRLERLRSDLSYLADDAWLDEICERIGDGLAYRIGLTAALDRLNDLLLDADILPDVEPVADLSAPHADILRTDCESSETTISRGVTQCHGAPRARHDGALDHGTGGGAIHFSGRPEK